MSGACIIVSLIITLACFGVLWFEDAWSDFYHWGPPFQVGSIVIETWGRWWVFVGLLVLYQASNVYIEETSGREFERKHLNHLKGLSGRLGPERGRSKTRGPTTPDLRFSHHLSPTLRQKRTRTSGRQRPKKRTVFVGQHLAQLRIHTHARSSRTDQETLEIGTK